MRDENLALMRRGYEAFATGDVDTLRAIAQEDQVWVTAGTGGFQPEYRGVDAVIGYLGQLMERTGGTFRDEPESFLADDDRVMVLEHVTASRDGRTLDTHFVHVYDIRDGKVARVTEYSAEPKKFEEFWS